MLWMKIRVFWREKSTTIMAEAGEPSFLPYSDNWKCRGHRAVEDHREEGLGREEGDKE